MKNIPGNIGVMKVFFSSERHNFLICSILLPAFLLKGIVSFASYDSWSHKVAEIVSWVCIICVSWSNFRVTCHFEVVLLILLLDQLPTRYFLSCYKVTDKSALYMELIRNE